MPPEVQEKAPEKASFEGGLLSNNNMDDILNQHERQNPAQDQDQDQAQDQNQNPQLVTRGRSFMDKGEAVFTDAEADAKEQAAIGARATLIARMQDENTKSQQEAQQMSNQHLVHKQRVMDAAILEAKERKKATFVAQAEYYAALSRTGPANAEQANQRFGQLINGMENADAETINLLAPSLGVIRENIEHGRGAFMRTLTFAVTRKRHAESALNKANQRYQESLQNIPRINREWNRTLLEYRRNNYKVRSRNYDRLFRKYYMLSRGEDLSAEGAGRNFLRQGQEGFDNANVNNAKNIAEYMGKYNDVQAITNAIEQNPFANIASEIVARKALGEGSSNTMEGLLKKHTMVTLEAFGVAEGNRQIRNLGEEQAGPQPVQRVRIKIDNQFKGYKAKNQRNAEGTLVVDENFAGKGDEARRNMTDLNLVIDERGANGAYLYSQKSAKLYNTRSKRTGQRTNGFYIDGEFISSNKDIIKNPGEAKSGFAKEAEQERLRAAIRRSDFFRHINKGTIQYYMNYDDSNRNASPQEIKEKFLAKRAGLFSGTKLLQNLYDGTLLGTAGGLFGAYVGDQKNIPFVPDDAIDKVYGKYASTSGSIMNLDKSFKLGYAGMAVAAITPVAAIFGQADYGAKLSTLLGSIVGMAQNIATFVDLRKKWKNCKPGDQKWPLVMDFIDNFLGLCGNITSLIDHIAKTLLSDQIRGICSVIRNVFGMLKDIISFIGSGVEKYRITKSDTALATAMEALRNNGAQANPDEVAEGEALSNNAQSKMFLSLARKRATRDQYNATFSFLSKGLDSAGTVMGLGEKSSWFNPISLPFKLAGKVVSFLGMGWNKIQGKGLRRSNIGTMLGDENLDKVSGFDMILKEETGINNKHYLSDLLRVFMTVDMHCLLHKSAANGDAGGLRLAKDVIKPYYQQKNNETIEDFLARVSFNRLLKAAGAPSDWRSVLLASIS